MKILIQKPDLRLTKRGWLIKRYYLEKWNGREWVKLDWMYEVGEFTTNDYWNYLTWKLSKQITENK